MTPQFETWANVTKPTAFPYVAPARGTTPPSDLPGIEDDEFDSAGTRLVDAISSWPGAAPLPAEPEAPAAPVITEPDRIPAYLRAARRAIDEVNEAIDRRTSGNAAPPLRATPPSANEQADALSELIELTSSDYYSAEQARALKARHYPDRRSRHPPALIDRALQRRPYDH